MDALKRLKLPTSRSRSCPPTAPEAAERPVEASVSSSRRRSSLRRVFSPPSIYVPPSAVSPEANGSDEDVDLGEESSTDIPPALPRRRPRPPRFCPPSAPQGSKALAQEPDSAAAVQRTGYHDAVLFRDRYETPFMLERRALSPVISEHTELPTRTGSPRTITSCATSLYSQRALDSPPLVASTSARHSSAPPASLHALFSPQLPKPPTLSDEFRPSSSHSLRRKRDDLRLIEDAHQKELDFRRRLDREEQHKWRKEWLEEKMNVQSQIACHPAWAHHRLGQLYWAAATQPHSPDPLNFAWAQYHLMQSIQHDGTDPDVHYALARVSEAASNAPSLPEHQAQGFADLAQEAYSNAIRLAPQRAAFLTSLGVFLCGQSRFAAARSVFERAVAAGAQGEKDEKAVAYANLGQLYEHHWPSVSGGQPASKGVRIVNLAHNLVRQVAQVELALAAYEQAIKLTRGGPLLQQYLLRFQALLHAQASRPTSTTTVLSPESSAALTAGIGSPATIATEIVDDPSKTGNELDFDDTVPEQLPFDDAPSSMQHNAKIDSPASTDAISLSPYNASVEQRRSPWGGVGAQPRQTEREQSAAPSSPAGSPDAAPSPNSPHSDLGESLLRPFSAPPKSALQSSGTSGRDDLLALLLRQHDSASGEAHDQVIGLLRAILERLPPLSTSAQASSDLYAMPPNPFYTHRVDDSTDWSPSSPSPTGYANRMHPHTSLHDDIGNSLGLVGADRRLAS